MQLENVEDMYPLSPAQQGMLFHDLLAPGSGVYCVQLAFTITGRLSVDALRQSWHAVVDRHAALCAAFYSEGLDQPLQIIRQRVTLPWQELDCRSLPGLESTAKMAAILKADRLRGFDVTEAPLLRVTLIRTADDTWRCVLTHHHLVLDGWSVGWVLRDVLACYQALASGEQPAWRTSRPYRDYIAWLGQQDMREAERFWRETLTGLERATPLGLARPSREPAGEHFLAEESCQLDVDFTSRLQAFARSSRSRSAL